MSEEFDDDELDGILDGALEAFDETSLTATPAKLEKDDEREAEEAPNPGNTPAVQIPEEGATPPVDGETSRAFEEALNALGELGVGQGEPDKDVTEDDMKLVEEFMKSLSNMTSSLGNPGKSSGVGPGDSGDAGGADATTNGSSAPPGVENLVDSIVGHLLSEDVLKAPMIQMRAAYADWLPKQAESLSAEELGRYSRQQELVNEICEKYEAKASSSEIMELLSKMQETGAPPDMVLKNLDAGAPGVGPALQAAELDKFADLCGVQ